jgi:hypothetical protein
MEDVAPHGIVEKQCQDAVVETRLLQERGRGVVEIAIASQASSNLSPSWAHLEA